MTQRLLPLKLLLVAILVTRSTSAQTTQTATAVDGSTPPAIAPGQPAGSYALSGFETVNAFSGGLNFHLPLLSTPGRARNNVSIAFPIQRQWIMQPTLPGGGSSTGGWAAFDVSDQYEAGFIATPSYAPGYMIVREVGTNATGCNGSQSMYQQTLTRLTYIDADGTQHDFVDALSGGVMLLTSPSSDANGQPVCVGTGPSRGRVWVTRDGTFWTFISDSALNDGTNNAGGAPPVPIMPTAVAGYLYQKDGTVLRIDGNGHPTSVRDRQGNYIAYTYGTNTLDPASYGRVTNISDTLGRQITVQYSIDASTSTVFDQYDKITYKGTGGVDRPIKVHYCFLDPTGHADASHPLRTSCANYAGTPAVPYQTLFGHESSTSKYNPMLVTFVELPDSRRYEFSYNIYGELSKVKLPTGGSIQYDYAAGDTAPGADPTGVIGLVNQGAHLQIYRRVKERRMYLNDSTLEGKTVYTPWNVAACATGISWCTYVGVEHRDVAGTLLAAERHSFYGGPNDPTSYFTDGKYYPLATEGKEFKTEFLDVEGTGTFDVKTTVARNQEVQTWEDRACLGGEPCPTGLGYGSSPVDSRVKQRDVLLVDTSQPSSESYLFDRYNNVTQRDETGFDGNGGTLNRRTTSQYLSTKTVGGTTWDYLQIPTVSGQYGTFNGNYSAIVHIRALPIQQSIYNMAQGGVEIGRTTYDYDTYTSNLPFTAPLASESGLVQWDSTVPAARGNPTKVSSWLLSGGSGTLDTYRRYDVAGNVVAVVDPRGNVTTVEYSDTYKNALPTKVTNPLSQFAQTTYDINTGAPASFIGLNGETITYVHADALDRLTEADFPDTGVTKFGYCDAGSTSTCPSGAPTNSVTKTVQQNSCQQTNSIVDTSLYDGLGRTSETRTSEGSSSIITVQSQFDGMSRAKKVSNPDRGTPAYFTTTSFDSLGRPKTITYPDNFVVTNSWTGSAVITATTDPNTGAVKRTYDAFGRVAQVTEDSGWSLQFTTKYLYDSLDNLTGVCQGGSFDASGNCSGGRGRKFIYDSVRRLISATNPESGLTTYTYDANGNLQTKKDARNWLTTFGAYDGVNRPTSKTYSNAAPNPESVAADPVTYVWDTVRKGSLSSVASGISLTEFTAYDVMGRVTHSRQTTNGVPYNFDYTYNLAGGLETEAYPSGRSIKTCYDPASRITQVTGTKNSVQTTYASFPATPSAAYWPHGAIKSLTRGDSLTEAWTYNNERMQPTGISVGTTGVPRSVFGMDLYYCANKGLSCADNSGNVKTTSLSVLGTDQNYTYDHLSRIASAEERLPSQAPIWTEMYGHDSYANHWVPAGAVESFTPTASTNFNASNQLLIQGSGYDAAGNQIAIGGYSYIWDAESRLVKSMITQIPVVNSYDGDGRRVQKVQCPAGTNPCTAASTGAQPTVYVYDAAGQLAAEYTVGWTPPASPCTTCYLTTDHLGSGRALTDTTGVKERHDYAPFGRELYAGTGPRTVALAYASSAVGEVLKVGFTGKQRDAELSSAAMQGLDYFGARNLSSAQGRFTSPDEPLIYQNPSDPQSWNLYSYAYNNPLVFVDVDGHEPCVNGINPENGNICVVHSEATPKVEPKKSSQPADVPLDSPLFLAVKRGVLQAEPGVNLAGAGLMVFGSLVAPIPMAIAQCGAGNCDKTNLAMAVLPEFGPIFKGATVLRAMRGLHASELLEKAGGFEQAVKDFESLKGAERTIPSTKGAIKVKELSDGSKAVVRSFSKDGHPTLEIQHVNGTYTEIRYK
jgi:RHS repeat-associated protein